MLRIRFMLSVILLMAGFGACSDDGSSGSNGGGTGTFDGTGGSDEDTTRDTNSESASNSDFGTNGSDSGRNSDDASTVGSDSETDTDPPAQKYSELWYSAGDSLVHISLSTQDGSVASLTENAMSGLPIGQNYLTMLDDGSLIGARLSSEDKLTYFYLIEQPPRDGSPAVYTDLGVMPDGIMLEGLYTDCDGRLYGMDTGVNNSSSEGNRLLRFTGDYLAGDFAYEVISDLSSAVVADIDDMGPGIDEDGEITDNPGLAIDTGTIYDFDYVTGTGTEVAKGGSWGIHALGGDLFEDDVSRIYLLDSEANLYELDPNSYEVSDILITGPTTTGQHSGWSGLAGPLTDCESGFPPVI